MSALRISEERVRQAMAQATPPSFVVEGSHFAAIEVEEQKSSPVISGTVTPFPPNNSRTREHLLSLFRKIDQSGTSFKTEEELNAEIDEMRRRNF